MSQRIAKILTRAFLLLLCLFPLLVLLWSGFPHFSPVFLKEVFTEQGNLRALVNTLVICSFTSLFAILLALPLAWAVGRTDLPARAVFKSLFAIPFLIPPYIGAVAWIELANPKTGLLNLLYQYVTGSGAPLFNIYSLGGLIWVMTLFFYPLAFLVLLSSLERIDASLEEAARMSGATAKRVFFSITLPLISPSLLGASLLVFAAAAASFGVPALIGTPFRLFVLTTKIYGYMQAYGEGLQKAILLSMLLMLGSLFLVFFNHWIVGKKRFTTIGGKVNRTAASKLGKTRPFVFSACVIFVGIAAVLPVFTLALTSLLKTYGGGFHWSNLSFAKYSATLFGMKSVRLALKNSLILGVGTATIATLFGFFVAYFQVRSSSFGAKLQGAIPTLLYATPGIVVAVALVLTFSGRFGLSLYNTGWILLLAYLVKYLHFSVAHLSAALSQIDPTLEEASRLCGASWWQTVRHILFPLLHSALIGSWFLILMPVLSELTMSILLYGPETEVIGTVLFELQNYADPQGAAVLATVVIALVLSLNFLVKWATRGRYGL